jgi:ribosomal protein L21E
VSLSEAFGPPLLKGVKVYPDNPFRLDFILDKGDWDIETGHAPSLQNESTRLIKYFLASITVPEQDLWVNLSPYEKDRIVPDAFGVTEMGRDLLAQDYLLKQITASVIYPEGEVGKAFWAKVYAEAFKKYGTTDIPVDTFNKVWIVPEKAVIYESNDSAYVVESKLKVMLESDYLAISKDTRHSTLDTRECPNLDGVIDPSSSVKCPVSSVSPTQDLAKSILREVVIPILEKEVNEGRNFAQLRQVYHSLILAVWYKDKIKESIFGKAYVDRRKVAGVDCRDGACPVSTPEETWHLYVEAFKKGAYNYIKEEVDPVTQETMPRKYFSGGARLGLVRDKLVKSHDTAMLSRAGSDQDLIVQVGLDAAMTNAPKHFINKFPMGISLLLQGLIKDLNAQRAPGIATLVDISDEVNRPVSVGTIEDTPLAEKNAGRRGSYESEQLQRILRELLINAYDAVHPHLGRITVRIFLSGENVSIHIENKGKIDFTELRRRLFEAGKEWRLYRNTQTGELAVSRPGPLRVYLEDHSMYGRTEFERISQATPYGKERLLIVDRAINTFITRFGESGLLFILGLSTKNDYLETPFDEEEMSSGAGLGLFDARRRARDLFGGDIRVESLPDSVRGIVDLPVADGAKKSDRAMMVRLLDTVLIQQALRERGQFDTDRQWVEKFLEMRDSDSLSRQVFEDVDGMDEGSRMDEALKVIRTTPTKQNNYYGLGQEGTPYGDWTWSQWVHQPMEGKGFSQFVVREINLCFPGAEGSREFFPNEPSLRNNIRSIYIVLRAIDDLARAEEGKPNPAPAGTDVAMGADFIVAELASGQPERIDSALFQLDNLRKDPEMIHRIASTAFQSMGIKLDIKEGDYGPVIAVKTSSGDYVGTLAMTIAKEPDQSSSLRMPVINIEKEGWRGRRIFPLLYRWLATETGFMKRFSGWPIIVHTTTRAGAASWERSGLFQANVTRKPGSGEYYRVEAVFPRWNVDQPVRMQNGGIDLARDLMGLQVQGAKAGPDAAMKAGKSGLPPIRVSRPRRVEDPTVTARLVKAGDKLGLLRYFFALNRASDESFDSGLMILKMDLDEFPLEKWPAILRAETRKVLDAYRLIWLQEAKSYEAMPFTMKTSIFKAQSILEANFPRIFSRPFTGDLKGSVIFSRTWGSHASTLLGKVILGQEEGEYNGNQIVRTIIHERLHLESNADEVLFLLGLDQVVEGMIEYLTQRMMLSEAAESLGVRIDPEDLRIGSYGYALVPYFREIFVTPALGEQPVRDFYLTGDLVPFARALRASVGGTPKAIRAFVRQHDRRGTVTIGGLDQVIKAFEYIANYRAGERPANDDAMETSKGGIDLTRDKMGLEVQNTGESVQFKFDPAKIQHLQDATGLTPIIIDIQPMTTSVPMFLGIKSEGGSPASG